MKETKKQRKLRQGMNYATLKAFGAGHKPPVYKNIAGFGEPSLFVKVKHGVPHVNPVNFGM